MSDGNADPPSPPEVETSERSILVLNRRKRNAKRITTKMRYELENLKASPPTNEEETGKREPLIQLLWDALGGHPTMTYQVSILSTVIENVRNVSVMNQKLLNTCVPRS